MDDGVLMMAMAMVMMNDDCDDDDDASVVDVVVDVVSAHRRWATVCAQLARPKVHMDTAQKQKLSQSGHHEDEARADNPTEAARCTKPSQDSKSETSQRNTE